MPYQKDTKKFIGTTERIQSGESNALSLPPPLSYFSCFSVSVDPKQIQPNSPKLFHPENRRNRRNAGSHPSKLRRHGRIRGHPGAPGTPKQAVGSYQRPATARQAPGPWSQWSGLCSEHRPRHAPHPGTAAARSLGFLVSLCRLAKLQMGKQVTSMCSREGSGISGRIIVPFSEKLRWK